MQVLLHLLTPKGQAVHSITTAESGSTQRYNHQAVTSTTATTQYKVLQPPPLLQLRDTKGSLCRYRDVLQLAVLL
jgi:hypothetical protein